MKKKQLKYWRDHYYQQYIDSRRECEGLKCDVAGQAAELKRLKQLIIEKDKRPGLPKKSDEIRIQELEKELEAKLQDISEMGTRIASQTDAAIKAQDRNANLEGRIKELESEVEALRAVGKGYWTYRKKDAWTPPPAPGAEQKPPSTS